jgi:hypothetical protein
MRGDHAIELGAELVDFLIADHPRGDQASIPIEAGDFFFGKHVGHILSRCA